MHLVLSKNVFDFLNDSNIMSIYQISHIKSNSLLVKENKRKLMELIYI